MNHLPPIHLDFTDCKYPLELHERIRTAFSFPEWYGCNWDAFYDLLSTNVAENHVIVTGLYALPDSLHSTIPYIIRILEDTRKDRLQDGEIFTYEIIS